MPKGLTIKENHIFSYSLLLGFETCMALCKISPLVSPLEICFNDGAVSVRVAEINEFCVDLN